MFVIVIGGGQVGSYLAALLINAGHKVRVIDTRKEIVERLQKSFPDDTVILGRGTSPSVLDKNGVRSANVVAAVTGSDETNLVACILARFEFNVPRVIARVNNPLNAWLFTPEMGVDVALNQADLMGHLIAEEMSLGDMMTLLKLRKGQFSIVEEKVHPDSLAVGKAIRDLMLPEECVLAAVLRKGELLIPKGSTILQAADEVIAVIHSDHMDQLADLLDTPENIR